MNRKIFKGITLFLSVSFIWGLSTTRAYAWDGKVDGTGTHAMIVTQSIKILENDLSKDEPQEIKKNLEILKNNIHDFKLGSTYPDYDPNEYDLYQDHFWDPDTGNNFTKDNKWYLAYAIPDTGESQLRKCSALARYEWQRGNYKKAAFYLGEAMHYFGDIDTPYHPSNVTAIDSLGHVKFETFAEENKEKYKISTTGFKTNESFYQNIIKDKDFNEWSKNYITDFAKKAKSLYYSHANMSCSWKNWDYAATKTLANSQIGTAGYIYRFLHDVSFNKEPLNKNLNELVVIIKTKNEKDAGTDDYIYFGMKTKSGKVQEWQLDNPGDDFARNSEDTYTLRLKEKNINYNDIESMWLRKKKFTKFTDQWKPEYIKVIANQNVEMEKNINKWIAGNETYNIK